MTDEMSCVKVSPVWEHFSISTTDNSKVTCKSCGANISRGGTSVAGFTTSNMIDHLRRRHHRIFEEVEEAQAVQKAEVKASSATSADSAGKAKQSSIVEAFNKAKRSASNEN
ncbi:hypothetical protein Btru_070018 [Bulinus truncatus]|nr:hypothetical protein Btru_070018 [Bulinus truncatus]